MDHPVQTDPKGSELSLKMANSRYLESEYVECDDSSDLCDDGEDGGEEEEPDEAGALGGAAHPADQPREEQGEAHAHNRIGEDLKSGLQNCRAHKMV